MDAGIFDSYCYGPGDLTAVHKGDSTLWLQLTDSAGRTAKAVYRGCVYWQMDLCHTGCHLSMVQQLSARELLMLHSSPALMALQKNTKNVAKLLEHWEKQHLSFYLHWGNFPEGDLLIVAESLDYRELA